MKSAFEVVRQGDRAADDGGQLAVIGGDCFSGGARPQSADDDGVLEQEEEAFVEPVLRVDHVEGVEAVELLQAGQKFQWQILDGVD